MTGSPIVVRDVRLDSGPDEVRLSGDIEGNRLFWTMPPREEVVLRGEPFVAGLLVSAMRAHRPIELPANAPVDAGFIAHLDLLQEIFARFFTGLRPVEVRIPTVAPRERVSGKMVGYSGGIDSSYSLLKLANRLDGAVLLDGIEYRDAEPRLMLQVDDELRTAAAGRGLPLVVIGTNAKFIGKAVGGHWHEFLGGALTSSAHALGLEEYWIASSDSWEILRPYGSHPITDPLWGSSRTTIFHHGCDARRIDKTRVLGAHPDLFDVVRVCFQGGAYNCGKCDKCLRTAVQYRVLGLTSRLMPPLTDAKALRKADLPGFHELVDWTDVLGEPEAANDPDLVREIERLTRRHHRHRLLREFDEYLLGGALRRLSGRG